jgi:hypothetical protein
MEEKIMAILLAFAPFIAFALVDRLMGPTEGLSAGAVVSVVFLVRDWVISKRSVTILKVGTALLFCGLTFYAVLGAATRFVVGVRLCVETGLLLIVLLSMAIGRPCTLQYAREQVAPTFWDSPTFIRTNYVITAGWAVAFAEMVIAEAVLLYVPGLPPRVGIIVIILALIGAAKFTGRYPERMKVRTAVQASPHPCRDGLLLLDDGVGIDRRGGELGVP